MYRVETEQGNLIANVPEIHYIKKNGDNFVSTSSLTAEAIILDGQIYNIAGYPSVGNFVAVNITEYDNIKSVSHKHFNLSFL